MHTPPSSTRSRTGPILAVVSLALMTVVSAVSGLNVALPDLARETGATQTQVTWIVDAYTVVFAGLLLFAGALGDRFGRRGLLVAGLGLFGTAAGLGMLTSDPTQLIVLRALMGIGAAAIMPTTLSVITTSFPEEDRPKAIGVWVGVAGGGAVLGLFGSGILLEFFSWSSFFGLNVVLAAVALVGTLLVVPGSVDADPPRLDLLGGLLSLVAVAGIVFGIIEGAEHGWGDELAVTGLSVGFLALAAFVVWELYVEQPMLGSTSTPKPVITPASISRCTRSVTAGADMSTRRASSAMLIRGSACSSASNRRLISSSTCVSDMRDLVSPMNRRKNGGTSFRMA